MSRIYINVIMKTICPPGYHYNGFVAAHDAIGRKCMTIYLDIRVENENEPVALKKNTWLGYS